MKQVINTVKKPNSELDKIEPTRAPEFLESEEPLEELLEEDEDPLLDEPEPEPEEPEDE